MNSAIAWLDERPPVDADLPSGKAKNEAGQFICTANRIEQARACKVI
ncbi:hypothetical protein G3N58_22355 [Paraburkholderia sp. Ac-20342]|nr:hypothetical protein [Paraburkholderia sp. Ac-20342]MBN3849547.1 hypothetical protein [Paraburkholderia sp. Ac-20342]